MSFIMHEFVYFGRSIPWIIIDALPYFRRWKLQDVHSPIHPRSNTNHVDQNPHTRRSMDLYKVCPATTFHGRVTSDIPVPSNSTLLWFPHRCSLPRHHDHGMANRKLLCHGRYIPLLGPSRSALGSSLQKHP